MDAPHVLVVEEVVDSLLFETDLMGNLIRRYSSIDNDNGPVMSRGKIIDDLDLDDTVKLDLTPDDEPKTREDDDQDNMRETGERNFGLLDAANDVLNKSALIDQPNGELMLGKNLVLRPNSPETANDGDQDESETDDEDYAEFDPMDYLFKSAPTNKSEMDKEQDDDQFYEASVNFDLDLLPVESETAGQDVPNECTNSTYPSNNSNHQIVYENKINDDDSDEDMRLELSSDQVETVQDNSQISGFDSEKCKNDKCIVEMVSIPENIAHELSRDLTPSNNSNHQIVCEQESDHNESDYEMRLDQSSDGLEGAQDDGSRRDLDGKRCKKDKHIVEPVSTPGKLENDTMPPTSPDLNQDDESIVEQDVSGLDDETCQKDRATKNQAKKNKKLQVTPIKGKVYNTRKNKRKKIKVSLDLGSEISSTSSSSDEESSSWSETTFSDADEEMDSSSDSFSEEPFICTRYNLRNRQL